MSERPFLFPPWLRGVFGDSVQYREPRISTPVTPSTVTMEVFDSSVTEGSGSSSEGSEEFPGLEDIAFVQNEDGEIVEVSMNGMPLWIDPHTVHRETTGEQ